MEVKLYDKIYITTYICDFGNVVINSIRKKTIKITNVGSLPIDFSLDGKFFKNQGYTITPERVTKLPPNEDITLQVQYQTKKNMKFGKSITTVPLEVKGGAKYMIEL